jgi:hypothetical protein
MIPALDILSYLYPYLVIIVSLFKIFPIRIIIEYVEALSFLILSPENKTF